MKGTRYTILLAGIIFLQSAMAQDFLSVNANISVAKELATAFRKGGRLLLHITTQPEREPKNRSEITLGVNTGNWDPSSAFFVNSRNKNVLANGLEKLSQPGKYYAQVVYKQNTDDGNENVAGNLYSEVDSFVLPSAINLQLHLQTLIPPSTIVTHRFVKTIQIKSQYLSDFFGKPKYLKAAVLLPSGYYDNLGKSYPICYRASGLNGRYDAINGIVTNQKFADGWFAKDAPQVIYVFLDSEGPYGDTYQVDSENNGPCGKALTEELIPALEKMVGYDATSHKRYLAGKSTGGWVALGLQIFYPDFFDGCWSYSPDPVDFSHYGLIDIYKDETIFYNRYGYLQPGRRTLYGEPTFSMKDWITGENVNSRTNDYRISGGQFGAYNAVFGPKGPDGLPTLMFDPLTGKIDHAIAKQWEKYDILKILENNWGVLGPKLQGKIWIWTGDMDGLYSNVATRFLEKFMAKTEHPRSDAHISFTAMAGHTKEWSDEAVIKMVAEKANKQNR